MQVSFKDYYHKLHENSEIANLRELLSQIDDAIETAKRTNTNDFEPRYIEFISKRVGELYDAIADKGMRLPVDMQGDAGDRPKHINTLNRLKGMVTSEQTIHKLNHIITLLS